MIVQAEVAGEIVEGSAVMGIRWVPGDNGRMYIKSNAEAVILDLSGRGTVYVLNAYLSDDERSNGGFWLQFLLFTFGMKANGRLEDLPRLKTLIGRYPVPHQRVSRGALPIIVAFEDKNKRETMFEVRAEEVSNHFGEDVHLLGMWFEFTEDEPTSHVPARLPVALNPNESYYSAFPKFDEHGDRITSRDFAFPQKFSKWAFVDREY